MVKQQREDISGLREEGDASRRWGVHQLGECRGSF